MSLLRLLLAFGRVAAQRELAYRANFAIQALQSLIGLGTALAGLAVVFAHTTRLAGWRPQEVLALVGVFELVGGAIGLVIQPSMQRLMEEVRLGTLDYALLQPADSQVLVSVREVAVYRLADVALGLGVLLFALARLGTRIGPGRALLFAVTLAAGGAVVYSVWLGLATCAFWLVRVDNILVIFETMYDAGRWPVAIYPGWLRGALTFIVPVALATSVPVEALTGRLGAPGLAGSLAAAAALLVLSRWFWRQGLRHYSGASS